MEKNSEPGCAGKPISAAMHMFSADLISGCRMFAELAKKANSINEVRYCNTACIFFATSLEMMFII